MTISLSDYLKMLTELMQVLRFKEAQIQSNIVNLRKGLLSLKDLSANVAIQCFIQNHHSVNSDIVRVYLKEYQKNQEVNFSDSTS